MVAADNDGSLKLIIREIGADLPVPIEILKIVPGMVVLIFCEEEDGILWGELLFDGAVPFDTVEFIIRAHAVVVLIVEIEGPSGVAVYAELRSDFAVLSIAA